jgi:hypothetical protein
MGWAPQQGYVDKLRHCAPAGEVEKNDTGKLFF